MEDLSKVSVELNSPAMMTLAPCFWWSMASTALTVAMVSDNSLGKYAVITHNVSFSHFTCTSDTFVSLEALLTSSLVRVATPWDLTPLVKEWQLQVSVGVESVVALSWVSVMWRTSTLSSIYIYVCSFWPPI